MPDDRIILVFCDAAHFQDGMRRAREMGATVERVITPGLTFSVRAPAGLLPQLRALGGCSAFPDHAVRPRGWDWSANLPAPSRVLDLDDALRTMSLSSGGGDGLVVGVVGTGVSDRVVPVADRVNLTAEPGDVIGHESAVASIVHAIAPEARILDVHVMTQGEARVSDVMAGVHAAAQRGARVLNLSLGTDQPASPDEPLAQLLDALATEWGVVSVVAAGNTGPGRGSVRAPAGARQAVTVAAANTAHRAAAFSARGPDASGRVRPDIAALGGDVDEALRVPTVGEMAKRPGVRGTSFSAGFITGFLAQRLPGLPAAAWPSAALSLLSATADRRGNGNAWKTNDLGYGVVNGSRASAAQRLQRLTGPLLWKPPF